MGEVDEPRPWLARGAHQVRQHRHRVARLDQRDVGLQVGGLEPDVRVEPCGTALLLGPVARRRTDGLHDPRRPGRVAERRHGRVRPATRDRQAKVIRGQPDAVHAQVPRRGVPRILLGDDEIEVARPRLPQRRLRLALRHRHPYERMLLREPREQLRHERQCRRLEHGDANATRRGFERRCQLGFGALQLGQDDIRVPHEDLGLRGQLHAAPDLLQQLDADLPLERRELLRDGGRGLVEGLGDVGDRPADLQLAKQLEPSHVQHLGLHRSVDPNVIARKSTLFLKRWRADTQGVARSQP
ncbi:MAG: hypothetical protein QM733_12820 [Ilumatobacteraceae bacterium]